MVYLIMPLLLQLLYHVKEALEIIQALLNIAW